MYVQQVIPKGISEQIRISKVIQSSIRLPDIDKGIVAKVEKDKLCKDYTGGRREDKGTERKGRKKRREVEQKREKTFKAF